MTGRAALAATIVLLVVPSAAVASGPRCFGERATLVYGGHDGYAPGTNRDDVIVVRGFVVATEGKRGDDRICVRRGGPVPLIDGGPGDDMIGATRQGAFVTGGGGDDVIRGGPGGDHLHGGGGSDRLRGGRGDDSADYGTARHRVRVDLGVGLALERNATDWLAGVESVFGSEGDDILVGDDGENALFGGKGSDVLSGLHGRDVVDGGDGRDSADGGADRDRCDAEEMSSCERRLPPLPDFPDDFYRLKGA